MAPSLHLTQCWLIINGISGLWHTLGSNVTSGHEYNPLGNYVLKITTISSKDTTISPQEKDTISLYIMEICYPLPLVQIGDTLVKVDWICILFQRQLLSIRVSIKCAYISGIRCLFAFWNWFGLYENHSRKSLSDFFEAITMEFNNITFSSSDLIQDTKMKIKYITVSVLLKSMSSSAFWKNCFREIWIDKITCHLQ